MKKNRKVSEPAEPRDEMRAEYDFSGGVRGKYVQRFREGTNIIILEPDVAAEFKDSAAVNDALREVLKSRRRGSRRPA